MSSSRSRSDASQVQIPATVMTTTSPPHNDLTQTGQRTDEYWMQQAITLAEKGLYTTRPNPAVGCVIVNNDQQVGAGFHPKAGMPHAEVFALREAGEQARGGTAYVTLEPCSHYGRTPPCADALVAAGIRRVVVASRDPNPLVSGKGIDKLRAAGIDVRQDVLKKEADQLNEGFFKAMRDGLPYVRLKIAESLDGRTAMPDGSSKWITGSEARQDVQLLRARSGAVISGSGTILADDPLLNVRHLPDKSVQQYFSQPLRVVLDRQNRTPASAQIYRSATPESPVLKVTDQASLPPSGAQTVAGLEYLAYTGLPALLHELKTRYHINDVMIEAGPALAGAFLEEGLVDELIVYMAPVMLGSNGRPAAWLDFHHLDEKLRFKFEHVTRVGDDLKLTLKPHPSAEH